MKIKRLLSILGLASAVFIGGMVTLILFPQPLFSHSYTFQKATVYSHTEVDQDAFNKALEEAFSFIRTSELYDADYAFDIFLAEPGLYNQFDDFIFGEWAAARAVSNNVIIKRVVNEKAGTVANGENHFDLSYVLAHEMIHCLQHHRYGMMAFNSISHPPLWNVEGYPEYISRKKVINKEEYTLQQGISDFLSRTKNRENDHDIIQIGERESTPYIYYKGRIMVEYLMDVKGWSYDDIMKSEETEETLFNDLMDWYQENNQQQ